MPGAPLLPVKIASCNAAAVVLEDVEVVAGLMASLKKLVQFLTFIRLWGGESPVADSLGVVGVILRIAAGCYVKDDSALPFLSETGLPAL